MIGDSAAGSCSSVSFMGQTDAIVEHPILACSRLNISENNTALLQNRTYLSYRHFHDVTKTRIFRIGGNFQFVSNLNIDRFTYGVEQTILNGGVSIETRIPMSRELGSRMDVIFDSVTPARDTLPLTDRDGEFGNISIVAKTLLYQNDRFLVSTGFGVTLPTANDVVVDGEINGGLIIIEGTPGLHAFSDLDFDVHVRNETVNVSPFLAWIWVPNDRFFHQGFLQFDIAANSARGHITSSGTIDTFTAGTFVPRESIAVDADEAAQLIQQTLMRLNLGIGYWVYQNPDSMWLQRLATLLELHYTTTLQNAKVHEAELLKYTVDQFGGAIDLPVNIMVGNGANRNDIVNLSMGTAAEMNNWMIINGLIIPLSGGDNKAFDFEYNVQFQRRF